MGLYLNSTAGSERFQRVKNGDFFVDKTMLMAQVLPRFTKEEHYLCVTRPRRFGKSINASMLAAFLGKHPCPELFADLNIASHPDYAKHLNQHNVIFCTFNKQFKATNITQWLEIIEEDIKADLLEAYPECVFRPHFSISQLFNEVTSKYPEEKFIFIFDEWDAVFEFDFVETDKDKQKYQRWLQELFKDQKYVEFAYLTGIRPVAVATSGSALNMFEDLTLLTDNELQQFFGFTQKEVDKLYQKYLTIHPEPKITPAGLEYWYDGYDTVDGLKLYNPRSVAFALRKNMLQSYWTKTGPYDEIYQQVKNNIPDMLDSVKDLVLGEPVTLEKYRYNAGQGTPKTKDEILSAMLAYGFVSVNKDQELRIPNYELFLEFADMLTVEPDLDYLYDMATMSKTLLKNLVDGKAEQAAATLEELHQLFAPQERFNSEAELAAVFRLGFIGIWNTYNVMQEVKAGTGKADVVLLPKNPGKELVIIELKVDASPQQAIEQIKTRNYQAIANQPVADGRERTGRVIAVGISYSKKDPAKAYSCAIEVLRETQLV